MKNKPVKSQFIAPRLASTPWKNRILWQKYKLITSYPVTISTGKLGAGKTINLVYFLTETYADNFYWYQLRQSNLSTIQFIINLIEAVNFNEEKIKHETSSLLNRLQENNIELKEAIEELINLKIKF